MAIDPSIALNANRPVIAPPNALTMYGQVAQTSNALIGMRAAQQQLAARQAQGQAIQSAIGPDGTYSPAAANQALASNPDAAYGVQDAITGNQALAQAQQTRAQGAQMHVNQTLTSLAVLPDSQLNSGSVKSALDALRAAGSISPQDEQSALADMPAAGADPAAVRQFIMRHTVANLAGPQAVQQIYGAQGTTNVGGQDVPTVTKSPMMGGGRSVVPGSLDLGLSPGEASTPTTIGVTPSGAPITGTRQAFINAAGGNTTSPLGTGRPSAIPASLRNPNATPLGTIGAGSPGYAPATDQPPAAAVQPGIVTGIGPAQQAAASAKGTASAAAFQDIANQGVQAQSQNAILGNMLGDTAGFTSGETGLNGYKATLQRQAPGIARVFGVDAASVAANESFDKLANQIAGAQGAGSDARLAVAQGGNPSSHLSQAGADQILRQLQGNADYTQVRAKLAASYPDQSDRAGFEAQVGAQLDPRAFQFDRMTPAQKKTYANSLTPDDRSKVQSAYNLAHKQGWLSSIASTPTATAAPSDSPRGH